MGVFATRSPFRPNAIGLSSVELEKVEIDRELGPVIYVRGVDLMDGTPIFDIKPYLAYADSHPDAVGGWTDVVERKYLQVECSEELLAKVHPAQHKALLAVLANDPRPRYQDDTHAPSEDGAALSENPCVIRNFYENSYNLHRRCVQRQSWSRWLGRYSGVERYREGNLRR